MGDCAEYSVSTIGTKSDRFGKGKSGDSGALFGVVLCSKGLLYAESK